MAKKKRKGNSPYVKAPVAQGVGGGPAATAGAAPHSPVPASSAKTLDQRRAAHAWETIEAAKASGRSGAFALHAKKLPMRIRAAGLGQALVFVAAKGKVGTVESNAGLVTLLQRINAWVLDERGLGGEGDLAAPTALLDQIRRRDAMFLKRATAEVMGWLQWVNRFAEAEGLRSAEDHADEQ